MTHMTETVGLCIAGIQMTVTIRAARLTLTQSLDLYA